MGRVPNRKLVFSVMGLLAACWLLAACRPAAPPSTGAADVVTSDDGLAQLTIPAGAWPNGIKLSDVHVTRVKPSSQAASSGADLPLASYRLEPDGLTWQQPITFTLTVAGQVQSLPLLWLVSKNKAEVLPSVQAAIDVAGNKTVISVPVSHFSTIAAAYGFFDVTISDPGTKGVREVFPVTVDVRRSALSGHVMTTLDNNGNLGIPTISIVKNGQSGPPLAFFVKITSENFAVKQGVFFATEPIVSPNYIADAPVRQSPSGGIISVTTNYLAGIVSVTRNFQCAQAGTAAITHNAFIEFQQEIDTFVLPAGAGANYQPPASALTKDPQKTGTTEVGYVITTSVDCVTVTPTPTPTIRPTDTQGPSPTPTSTPTRTPTTTSTATSTPTSTPSPTPTPTPLPLPKVTKFVALFVPAERSTYYTVTASDPNGGQLKYAWSKVQPPGLACGLFGPTDQATTVWQHADAPLGNCPNEPVHMATITVVVSNAAGSVTCAYKDGSASGTVVQCVNSR